MSYLALYRKYRPSSFDEVVGQDKVIKIIGNAISNNKVSHAYLFSGPRGTGKTTTAKIIAKMVNCNNLIDGNPCNECDSCKNILNSSDVVEIDAASNNGVDEIREIRNKVNLVPTSCKYKIYIIDEVHMLTTQAFNALLKTLEEPPSHVIFILATTEIFKIPLTISSRCQKFQFTKISDVDIVGRLKIICENENISIQEDALFEVARLSDGGLRDAINLLDQLTSCQSDTIKIDDVYRISGSVSYEDLYLLLFNIKNNNCKDIIDFVENIDRVGKNIFKFVEEIIIFLKDVLVFKNTSTFTNIEVKNDKIKEISDLYDEIILYKIIDELNDLLIRMKSANYPAILLIVTFLKISNNFFNNNVNIYIDKKLDLQDSNTTESSDLDIIENDAKTYDININDELINIRINNALALAEKSILVDIKKKWNSMSDYLLDDKYSSIVGLLTDVSPVVASPNYLVLECKFESSVDRLNMLTADLSDLLKDIFDVEYVVVSVSSDRWKEIRSKYVSDRKKGVVYKVIEESNLKSNKEIDSSVKKLVDLLGEDVIEYR